MMNTREQTSAEDDSADCAYCFLVPDPDMAGVSALFDSHFRNNGDAHAHANHAQNDAELVALEGNLRIDAGAVACGNGAEVSELALFHNGAVPF